MNSVIRSQYTNVSIFLGLENTENVTKRHHFYFYPLYTDTVPLILCVILSLFVVSLVSAISSDDSTVATSGRLTLNIESDCVEEVTSGNFSVTLEYGVGMCKTIADLQRTETVMETITSPSGVQIPVGTTSAAQLCFNATLLCNNRTVDKTSNLDFERCLVSSLNQTVLGPEFTFSPNVGNGTVSHLTTVPLSCRNSLLVPTGVPVGTCTGGTWMISSSACECKFYL